MPIIRDQKRLYIKTSQKTRHSNLDRGIKDGAKEHLAKVKQHWLCKHCLTLVTDSCPPNNLDYHVCWLLSHAGGIQTSRIWNLRTSLTECRFAVDLGYSAWRNDPQICPVFTNDWPHAALHATATAAATFDSSVDMSSIFLSCWVVKMELWISFVPFPVMISYDRKKCAELRRNVCCIKDTVVTR